MGKKCPECNWEVNLLVRPEGSESEYMCGNCYIDKLIENGVLESINTEEDTERFCTKCGKLSDLLEDEDICKTCAEERGRI